MEKYTPKNLWLFQIGPGFSIIEEVNLCFFLLLFCFVFCFGGKEFTAYECVNLRLQNVHNLKKQLQPCNNYKFRLKTQHPRKLPAEHDRKVAAILRKIRE